MAWWLTVYCRKRVADLSAEQLEIGLRNGDPSAPAGVDYAELGDEYELDDEVVEAALAHLVVERTGDGPLDVHVRYRSEADARPIVVHFWQQGARVAEEIQEAIDNREPPEPALARLRAATEVVGIELGFSQLRDMGLVLACELGRYLAQKGDGIFVDDDNEWYAVVDGEFADPE